MVAVPFSTRKSPASGPQAVRFSTRKWFRFGRGIPSARTIAEWRAAYDLQTEAQRRQFWQGVRTVGAQFIANFVTTDLPIIVATSVLSSGTATLAAATLRVATGVRMARRAFLAMELAASIPIGNALTSVVHGTPIDLSVMGGLKQGGFMMGTQIGLKIIGKIASSAFASLRARLPNAQQPVAPWGQLASTIGGQPINAADLARMRAAFERNGGVILQGPQVDAYLLMRARQMGASNVGELTDNARQILLPTNPTRTAIFEQRADKMLTDGGNCG